MSQNTQYGYVKIIKVPAGEAPEWVRKAWVGLTLPCSPLMQVPDTPELGVLSGDPVAEDTGHCIRGRYGVSVPQTRALSILEEYDPLAATWWRDHGFPIAKEGEDHFGFAAEEVEEVHGMTRGTIHELSDEMMGDPYR